MKRKSNSKPRLSLSYILGGGLLKEDFIVRHTKMIFLLVICIIIFIGNRYSCTEKVKQIDTLRKQLAEKKVEAQFLSVELTKYSRRSQIETQIRQQNLGLEEAGTPYYILRK